MKTLEERTLNLEQGKPEWLRARVGRPSASQFSRIITADGKDSGSWEDYAFELIADSIKPEETGQGGVDNQHTKRGHDLEPEARQAFEDAMAHVQLEIRQVGFVLAQDGVAGCSPDGLCYEPVGITNLDGQNAAVAGLEIKCPLNKVHAEYVYYGSLPRKYSQQVHGSMAVTGLNFWYFMSYCRGMQPMILRIERDEYTEKVASAVTRFTDFYKALRTKLIPKLTIPNQ